MAATGVWTFMPLSGAKSAGRLAMLDAADYERVGDGWYLSAGYPSRQRDGLLSYLHREVLNLKFGDGRRVDHRNRDKLDNRRCNLRLCEHAENLQNLGLNSDNKSGFRGVSFDNGTQRWRATVAVAGRTYQLGRFDSADEAAEVVRKFRREHMPYSEMDRDGERR